MVRLIALFATLVLCARCLADPSRPIDFNRDIRPIFSNSCYACHGPDKGARKADLRLDTKQGLFGEIDDVFPVVPGKLEDSQIYLRITSDDDEFRMPRPNSGKTISPKQIELIKQWIEQGAPWKDHWSYEPPVKSPPPAQRKNPFVRNDIDCFVLTAMREHGLAPSKQADRATLIRRLSLDLIGLPPTMEEVDAFVNDSSESAYERIVDRLLASPHFGERMAVYWLDLVRYADSIGYHSDNPRTVSPYRDYVIDSFNRNKPFDQFTVEQLAGDLIQEKPTNEQKIASCYNRLLETTEEGGAQAKEYIAKYAADRVRNVSNVWLAATMGCCQCHDHKFDPYSTKDFYSMAAFFADIQEPAIGKVTPELLLPTEPQRVALAEFEEQIAGQKKILDTPTPELAAAQEQWEKSFDPKKQDVDWKILTPFDTSTRNGTVLYISEDQSIGAAGNNPDKDTYTVKFKTDLKGITALRLEVMGSLGRARNGNFVLTEFSASAIPPQTTPERRDVILSGTPRRIWLPSGVKILREYTQDDKPPAAAPVEFSSASADFEQLDPGNAAKYKAAASTQPNKPGLLGWAINGGQGRNHYAVFESKQDLGGDKETIITITMRQDYGEMHTIARFRLSATTAPRPVRAIPSPPADVAKILEIESDKRTNEQKAAIAKYYRSIAPILAPTREALSQIEKKKATYLDGVRKTLVTVHGKPRDVRVLARGNWQDDSGEIVQPAAPHFMKPIDAACAIVTNHPTTEPARSTRLDLARWIISRDNPLAARVFVNRLWKLFFGAGLAGSLDDFGSQGRWPTHPELLDWLACEFMDSDWDIKHMVRLIVTSGAYMQTSDTTPQLRERDPYNLWLARQGRFRIDAEFVRDNALAVSGLLVDTIGGESVRPYQPAGYWDFLNFPKRTWEPDHAEKQYRRGLYTWWQRTFLHPSLLAFDATGHEECIAERARSNTPQQALVLLNDPTYVEAARVFAEKICKQGGTSDSERIRWAMKRTLARGPADQELAILESLLKTGRGAYAKNPEDAKKLLAVGETPASNEIDPAELAAWTNVARAILNLHETITRS